MATGYTAVQWNRQKRLYDLALAAVIALALTGYIVASLAAHPEITIETLIIRGTALTALLLLHLALCIGPLARFDRRFLPLLYNRRHLGVSAFALALVHASLATFQFHALAGVNPLGSVVTAYRRDYSSLAHFPFEPLGLGALAILFLMAATSHDFWLRNLGPSFWKLLHLAVFAAFGLAVLHVALGALQSELSRAYPALLALGLACVLGLHAAAAWREVRVDVPGTGAVEDGFEPACRVDEIEEGRGKTVRVGSERVALFRWRGRIYATSNVCRHQGGPLGEGRILDGCVTCPWHGWQYRPADGQSPPPFHERIETYRVRVEDGIVHVDPRADPPGTPQPGAVAVAGAPAIEEADLLA